MSYLLFKSHDYLMHGVGDNYLSLEEIYSSSLICGMDKNYSSGASSIAHASY